MKGILRTAFWWALLFGVAQAQVVATLPAVARVIEPVTGPVSVLLPPGQSPHQWQLRPSQLRALADARLVVLVTPALERPVHQWLKRHDRLGHALVWSELADVEVLGEAEHHAHHDADIGMNPHLWLSPHNARTLLHAVAQRLPEQRGRLPGALRRLDEAVKDVRKMLEPVRQRPFLVLHDAFAYFEHDFGLSKSGVIELDANSHLGLKRLMAMRERIEQERIRCIIYPAHQSPRLLKRLVKGLDVRLEPLDALGWRQKSYAGWLVELAQGYRRCLMH